MLMLQSRVFIIRYSDDSFYNKHYFLSHSLNTCDPLFETISATDDVLIKRLLVGNAEVTRLMSCHVYISVGCSYAVIMKEARGQKGIMDLIEMRKY